MSNKTVKLVVNYEDNLIKLLTMCVKSLNSMEVHERLELDDLTIKIREDVSGHYVVNILITSDEVNSNE